MTTVKGGWVSPEPGTGLTRAYVLMQDGSWERTATDWDYVHLHGWAIRTARNEVGAAVALVHGREVDVIANCPDCGGEGRAEYFTGRGRLTPDTEERTCEGCNGEGYTVKEAKR